MALQPVRRRFSVQQYYQMAEAGIFREDDRVELIDGEVVQMPPIGPGHASSVTRVTNLFASRAAGRFLVGVQNPLRLGGHEEPVPDVLVSRPRPDFYASGHPTASDVLLLIEVADTSARYDRQVKLPLYARAAVPEVWLMELARDAITSHRDPDPAKGRYREVRTFHCAEKLRAGLLPELELAVEELLGATPP